MRDLKAVIFHKILIIWAIHLFSLQNYVAAQSEGRQLVDAEQILSTAEEFFNASNFTQAAKYYNDAAFIFWEQHRNIKAAEAFEKSLKCNEQIGNRNAQKVVWGHLGQIYFEQSDWDKSIKAFENQLSISRQQKRQQEVASILINLSNVFLAAEKTVRAIQTLEEAAVVAGELNSVALMKNTYALLAQAHEKAGNTKESRAYFDKFSALDKHIQQEYIKQKQTEAAQMVEQAQTQTTIAEQEKQKTKEELSVEREKRVIAEQTIEEVEQLTLEQKLQIELMEKEAHFRKEQLKSQQTIRKYLTAFIGVLLVFVLTVVLAYIQKRKDNKVLARQKALIEQKNEELGLAFSKIQRQNKNITDSIEYAERIQSALLPPLQMLKAILPDSFVILKPRDIVSGDFYWIKRFLLDENGLIKHTDIEGEIPRNADAVTVIACVDCTGHGVPGAFMSMIGFNLLENLIRKAILDPGALLTQLHESVKNALKQNVSNNNDGMDMSLCVFHEKSGELLFAGARNPLLVASPGKLKVIKGDGTSIGGKQPEKQRIFSTSSIQVEPEMSFYMYTDGFTDQFGGPEPFKFTSARLRRLIESSAHLNMKEQHQLFEKAFVDWKGNQDQLDDVLLIGFRFPS